MTAAPADLSDSDGGGAPPPQSAGSAGLRLDKWLWHARFAKSRGLAAKLITEKGVRVNGTRAAKPSAAVRPGDVLTFVLGVHVRVIRVQALGTRRGPETPAPAAARERGAGRPTKAQRRALDRLRDPEG